MAIPTANSNNGVDYSDEYYTPANYHEPLGQFDHDPFAGPTSCIARINNRTEDGFTIPWIGRVFMQPPYSKKAKQRAFARLSAHGTGTALVPASTDTAWFAKAFEQADAVVLVTGRINFIRPGGKVSKNAGGSAYFAYGQEDALILKKAIINGAIKGIIIK